MMNQLKMILVICVLIGFMGCSPSDPPKTGGTDNGKTPASGETPVFSLAWSEYPSWSVFGVAHEKGIINGKEGKLGPVEKKWGVDIVLKQVDYDTCITMYGSSTVDAVCITNMDILAPSVGRDSVAVLPTSTSVGADACIVVGIETLEQLKGKTTYGLEKSVAQYAFERAIELKGGNPADYPFKNMDPAVAATAMQTNQPNIESIQVWNPFVLQTLRTREGSKVLFDSSVIPEEIIDMVVIGKDSLAKPGGDKFASAIVETFYEVNKLLADPKEGDATLVALGAKFSSLGLKDMKIVVEQTQFYKTADAATTLFTDKKFQTQTTPRVVDFCVSHNITDKKPTVGFEKDDAQVNYTTKYLKAVQGK